LVQVQRRLWAEWGKLERAKEGSFRNRGYRMAQAVLSREDPRETFLKNLPAQPAPINVVFPVRLPAQLSLAHACMPAAAMEDERLAGMHQCCRLHTKSGWCGGGCDTWLPMGGGATQCACCGGRSPCCHR
jgi:hypothetical protein